MGDRLLREDKLVMGDRLIMEVKKLIEDRIAMDSNLLRLLGNLGNGKVLLHIAGLMCLTQRRLLLIRNTAVNKGSNMCYKF
jgi:hypothetical protein